MTASGSPRCFALVPCAGMGARSAAGQPKQYVPVAGRALVAHTLDALAAVPRLVATLVVLASDDRRFEAEVPGFVGERAWIARCGGDRRAQTVANGLAELSARGVRPDDWVLVHDAARCLLRPEWVERLIDACGDDDVGGLLALPLADTLKQEVDGRVVTTLDRRGKWLAQTPQMFRFGLLQRGLAHCAAGVTDESGAIESLGLKPKLIEGDSENLKITWPADFALAQRVLAERGAARAKGVT